jgi:alanine-glyoxylate transaminase/serine-glyoxylate transaminase/serine-pyruvate transaminase
MAAIGPALSRARRRSAMPGPASLAAGREFLAIPGPSTLPDRVVQAMARPSADIYAPELEALTDGLLRDLAAIARTRGRAFVHIANGHGGWEAAIANLFSRGDRALVLESGRFAVGWGEMAAAMGVEVEVLHAAPGRAVDPDAVERRLRADRAGAIRAVLVVLVDTASSVRNDVAAIRAAIDAAGHPALFMVDVIASLGCMPFEMDAWGVDAAVGGSQKGLMAPPGLAFCWAGERAMEAHARADLRTQYWDWTLRLERPHYRKYCGTPPTHLLFAQRAALDLLLAEGLEAAWARHAALAGAVRAAVGAWREGGALDFAVPAPAERADSVTTVATPGLDADAFRAFCRERLGLVLGVGLGSLEGRAFRIGHMGWLNAPMVMGTLGAAEAGLLALGAPLGPGGLEAAAAAIAAACRPDDAQGAGAVAT